MKILLIALFLLVSCGKRTKVITGVPGKDGESCYAETRDQKKFIVCGDSEFEVLDGSNGKDGQNGVDGKDGSNGENGSDGSFDGYLEYKEVCPDIIGSYKQTLIMLNNKYLSYMFDKKGNNRLVILEENVTYTTADGRNVLFILINGEIDCSLN